MHVPTEETGQSNQPSALLWVTGNNWGAMMLKPISVQLVLACLFAICLFYPSLRSGQPLSNLMDEELPWWFLPTFGLAFLVLLLGWFHGYSMSRFAHVRAYIEDDALVFRPHWSLGWAKRYPLHTLANIRAEPLHFRENRGRTIAFEYNYLTKTPYRFAFDEAGLEAFIEMVREHNLGLLADNLR